MSRKRATRDGLELFLDAICNMFGGFIFIMLFVVVSIRMSTEEQRAELKASGIEPVKEVELETLRVEIDRLNKDIKNVVKQQEDSRKFVEDLVDPNALEMYRETLAALKTVRDVEFQSGELQTQIDAIEDALKQAETERDRVKEELKDAEKTVNDVKEEVEKVRKKNTRKTSPPRLRETDKVEINCMLKYGKLYFLREYGSSGTTLKSLGDDFMVVDTMTPSLTNPFLKGLKVEPKPWKGTDLNAPDVDYQLSILFKRFSPARHYIAVCVAHDSFSEYGVLASYLKNAGFGIRPVTLAPGEFVVDRGGRGRFQ